MSADQELFRHARGYYVTKALLALWRTGLLARAAAGEELDVTGVAAEGYDAELLGALLDYLTTRGYFEWLHEGRYRLSAAGCDAARYYGYLPMMVGAYEPVFGHLEAVLSGELVYGRDVQRSAQELAGSLTALEQNLLGQVVELMRTEGSGKVLDLGCGSARMLVRICRLSDSVRAVGVDRDEATCAVARRTIEEEGLQDRVTIARADVADVGSLPAAGGVDVTTAMFVMHEILRQCGEEGTVACLRGLAELMGPRGRFLMVEVSRTTSHEAQEDLLFIPEYELFHRFSNQRLASRQEWERILAQAGMEVRRVVPADMCQAICVVAAPV